MKHDELYKEQFDLLSFSTNEYEQSVDFIRRKIIPQLETLHHFLDVGAGSGNLCKPLSPLFDRTTVVEPNAPYFTDLINWASANNVQMDGHNGDWLDYHFEEAVDLAVIAHVLYFVDPAKRAEFVRKAYNLVKPGGYLILILISTTSGITRLYRHLLPESDYRNMPSIESLAVELHAQGYDLTHLDLFDAEIHLPTRRDLHQLIDFVVVEKADFSDEQQLAARESYIDSYLTQGDSYAINSNIGILSIQKP